MVLVVGGGVGVGYGVGSRKGRFRASLRFRRVPLERIVVWWSTGVGDWSVVVVGRGGIVGRKWSGRYRAL